MTNLEEQKKQYESGDYDCYGQVLHGVWEKQSTFKYGNAYKLIHKSHSNIADEQGVEYKPNRIEVIGENGRDYNSFLKEGHYDIHIQDDGRTIKLFEVKPKWYDNPDNFPALITNGSYMFIRIETKEDFLEEHDSSNRWRLATRAELDSLYIEEK